MKILVTGGSGFLGSHIADALSDAAHEVTIFDIRKSPYLRPDQKMKKGALLINAARGGLVDEDALYNALSSGHLGGAALDCFEDEPYTGKLKELDNVLLTAHIGSYAQEGRVLMERQAVENLFRELKKAGYIK